jgi:6-phosphogluconolactonase
MKLQVYENAEQLSKSVANWFIQTVKNTLQKQPRCCIALAGGNTPKQLYSLLAQPMYQSQIDWSKIHVFWGDERFVPFHDERNNAKMAFDTLLNKVPIPKNQIHIMQTEGISAQQSAANYEAVLHSYFSDHNSATFDLFLLGMGDDGHALSLFPGKTEVIFEKNKWCASLWVESQNMERITLTPPVVNRSACIAFLVSGANKANALHYVLEGSYEPEKFPSQVIQPESGELFWFVDKEAAAQLSSVNNKSL